MSADKTAGVITGILLAIMGAAPSGWAQPCPEMPTTPWSTATELRDDNACLVSDAHTPGELLILTGAFDPAAQFSVTFADPGLTAAAVEVPAVRTSPTTLTTVVPPLLPPIVSEGGDVRVEVRSGGVTQDFTVRLRSLPAIASAQPAGTITLGYLRGALRQVEQRQGTNAALSSLIPALGTLLEGLQPLLNDPSATFWLGTLRGVPMPIQAADLGATDQWILTLLHAQGRLAAPPMPSTGADAAPLEIPCVSQAGAAHDLEQAILDPHTAPEEALWGRYFSPGASPPASCADAVVQYAIGYLGFAETLMGADLLAGAGPLGAVLVETGSVLWLETVAEAGVVTGLLDLAVSVRTLVEAPVAHTFVTDSSGPLHYTALLNRQLLDSLLAASAEPSTLSTANPSPLASDPSVSLEPYKSYKSAISGSTRKSA